MATEVQTASSLLSAVFLSTRPFHSASPRVSLSMLAVDPFYADYEATKRIGSGAFANVFLARRRKTNCYFAAKFLDPSFRKYGSDSKAGRLLFWINRNLEHLSQRLQHSKN